MFSERENEMVDLDVLKRLWDQGDTDVWEWDWADDAYSGAFTERRRAYVEEQLRQLQSRRTEAPAEYRTLEFQTINTRTGQILRHGPMVLGHCEADRGDRSPRGSVSIWHPMCPAHQDTVMGIQPGPSGIPGGGQGLFSTGAFSKNQAIVPYIGETLHTKPTGVHVAYAIELNTRPRTWVDAAAKRGVAALANHTCQSNANGKFVQLSMGTERIQRLLARQPGATEFTIRHRREGLIRVPRALVHHLAHSSQWLVAKGHIPAGAEIVVPYGAWFHRDLEHRVVAMQ